MGSSKRTKGHRQKLTLVKIGEILSSGADKSDVKAAIGTGSVSAAAVTAMEERYALNKTDQAEMAKRVKNNQAEEKSAKPAKAKKAKAAPAAEGADDLSKISGVGPVIVGKQGDVKVGKSARERTNNKVKLQTRKNKRNHR